MTVMAPLIDYRLLADAIAFYSARGYQQVEVPWLVGADAILATIPPQHLDGAMMVEQRSEYLVGSAEQGFLEIDLPPGRYMAVSPCFRAGEVDALHQETFMKLELHQTSDTDLSYVHDMIDDACEFFDQHCGSRPLFINDTADGWDIEIAGIEVGSYGVRDSGGRTWVYGTGLALPRFSLACDAG